MARKPKKAGKKPEGLTPKQEAFAQAYVETSNASEAYRRAYNAENTKDTVVHVKAAELMRNGKVTVRIAELQQAIAKRHEISIDRIVKELSLIGFSNMSDFIKVQPDGSAYVDLSGLTRDKAAAISEVTSEVYMEGSGEEARAVKRTKFKLSDKRAALVDLGKHLGMFIERKELTGPNGGPINVELTDKMAVARWIAFELASVQPPSEDSVH